MDRLASRSLSLLLAVAAPACFSPEYGSAPFTCLRSKLCPEGYSCIEGTCRRGGRDGSGHPDGARPEQPPALDRSSIERPSLDLAVVDRRPDSPPPSCPPGYCYIPAGTFVMGSPPTEPCREPDNDPNLKETAHTVTLTRGFCLGCREVTQKEFRDLMGYNPSQSCDFPGSCSFPAYASYPVEGLCWHEAAAYCNALTLNPSQRCYSCYGTGSSVRCTTQASDIYACKGFRLPTEAEWERAYRAGSSSAFYNGAITSCSGTDPNASAIGWYDANSGSDTQPVAQKAPNAWGLYDMAGNVWELMQDARVEDLGSAAVTDPVYSTSFDGQRVLRSGAAYKLASYLRAAQRQDVPPAYHPGVLIGVRCAQTQP